MNGVYLQPVKIRDFGGYKMTEEVRTSTVSERPAETPELLPSYFSRIDKGRLLSRGEEMSLARGAQAGDSRARQRLIEKNLRLVVSIAKKYRGQGLPFWGLTSAGKRGAATGAER